jgi:tRNA nucleotidyltransferase/poly(A) polymerase
VRSRSGDDRLAALRALPAVRALAAESGGTRVWLVGGAVRDALLGKPAGDLDAIVERHSGEIASRLAQRLPGRLVSLGGERFAALRLVTRDGDLDLWELGEAPLEADLERRDFTVNAMALDLGDGELRDPFGGRRDLAARTLRATRVGVFTEDPLRVVRLARFAATLDGFSPDPPTVELARAAAPELDRVAGERVRGELERLFGAPYAAGLGRLAEAGAWPRLWRDAESPAAPHIGISATAEALDARLPAPADDATADRVASGHALALCLASGDPEGRGRALASLAGRSIVSRLEARAIALRLERIRQPPPESAGDLAWWLHGAGTAHRHCAALAAALADEALRKRWDAVLAAAPPLLAARGGEVLDPRPLLDGGEIGRLLGLPPGPRLGAAARRLLEAQVRGEVRSRGEAEALLARADGDQALPLPTRR